jgi:hypothetical protein
MPLSRLTDFPKTTKNAIKNIGKYPTLAVTFLASDPPTHQEGMRLFLFVGPLMLPRGAMEKENKKRRRYPGYPGK